MFIVLKTDMVSKANPHIWKIDCESMLQKFIPFKEDGKVKYKNTFTVISYVMEI